MNEKKKKGAEKPLFCGKNMIEKLSSPEVATALPMLAMAFTYGIRKLIGYRDNWTCQWEEGCDIGRDGQPARFQDGFMVDAAHYDHDHQSEAYDDPDNGRILCLYHHALDEIAKGNMQGLALLSRLDPYTVHARKAMKKYPWLNGYKKVQDILDE